MQVGTIDVEERSHSPVDAVSKGRCAAPTVSPDHHFVVPGTTRSSEPFVGAHCGGCRGTSITDQRPVTGGVVSYS